MNFSFLKVLGALHDDSAETQDPTADVVESAVGVPVATGMEPEQWLKANTSYIERASKRLSGSGAK
jgi:hypothetical protein